MATNLTLSQEELIELSKKRVFNGQITLRKDNRKVTVAFTANAYVKMYALVDEFSKEVQWHGLVSRLGESLFLVEDILIFPHVASSTTVVSDQEEYEEWMNGLTDEQFNACRFHGHSHVHMQVAPSGVDLTYRRNLIENFSTNPLPDEDQFYIFLIVNKRREFSGQVYDITNNALYEKDEINIKILVENDWLSNFVAAAKKIVKDPPVAQVQATNTQNKHANGNGTPMSEHNARNNAQMSIYPHQYETDEEWQNRVYGGGSSNKKETTYPACGFKGGKYER